MIAILYHWKIKQGREKDFEAAWLAVTKYFYENCGSYGSRLHTADDGTYYAYAQWPSSAFRESALISDSKIKISREVMLSAIEESFPEVKLNVNSSFFKDTPQIRIARPTLNFDLVKKFYIDGLGFKILGEFVDHEGFDGLMVGHQDYPYHFEFTKQKNSPIKPTPTSEDLIVFYLSQQSDWKSTIDRMNNLNFKCIQSHNPYWDKNGKTFEDADGYRVVIQNSSWIP